MMQFKTSEDGIEVIIKQDPVDAAAINCELASMENLVRVSLMQPVSKLQDLSFLEGLPTLRRLHINCLPADTDLSCLESLPLLHEITTGDRCWFDCSILPNLPRLRIFRAGPATKNFSSLAKCGSLEWIELRGIRSKDCSFLGDLAALQRLRLWDCRIKHTDGINRCTSIIDLDLGRTSIVEVEALTSMSVLRTLKMEYCKDVVDPSPLGKCVSLRQLNVSHCRFTVDAKLINALPNLEIFVALSVKLSNEACQALLKLQGLQKISVPKEYCEIFARRSNDMEVHCY